MSGKGFRVLDSAGREKHVGGLTGATGLTGPSGAQGPAGFGVPGVDGKAGLDGFPGPPGLVGATGLTGAIGPQGPMGQGTPGNDGKDGFDGWPGPAGPTGPKGADGAPGGGGFYFTHLAGAYGNGDPGLLMQFVQRGSVAAPTPTNISTSVARCCFFNLPFDLTVNKFRYYGIGATTGLYHVAIYRYSDLARLGIADDFNTAANAWGSAGSNLGISLVANTLYFIAVSVDTASSTVGVQSFGTTIIATAAQHAR